MVKRNIPASETGMLKVWMNVDATLAAATLLDVPIETGTLLFPLSLRCPPSPRLKPNQNSSARTHLPKPFSWPHVSLVARKPNRFRGRTVVFGGNSNDIPNGSRFLDENGVVDDMDGYLNYLWSMTLFGTPRHHGNSLLLQFLLLLSAFVPKCFYQYHCCLLNGRHALLVMELQ
ncbi:hypothetical protein POTOM_009593 [Populus tomentosa]|uniref:Uncharacterized protein n=1 Tax=Populus tomentosa TaxID=118781 RepID=A0A8X8ABQ1_POPTO|nr:hypothetical protein POTOM_009593 [Populus tomentosa]